MGELPLVVLFTTSLIYTADVLRPAVLGANPSHAVQVASGSLLDRIYNEVHRAGVAIRGFAAALTS